MPGARVEHDIEPNPLKTTNSSLSVLACLLLLGQFVISCLRTLLLLGLALVGAALNNLKDNSKFLLMLMRLLVA